ncbi:MAG: hypothetical protein LH609_21690 [Rudanella sp.]|nr:hypothetical protein [Rudanella sp.]
MTFDDQGNLFPYELLRSDISSIAEHLGGTSTRNRLLTLFSQYVNELSDTLNCSFEQLVGGSFVNCKAQPNDIDVANLVALPDPEDEVIDAIMPFLTLGGSLETFSVDGHLIPVYDKSDERYANTVARIAYFRKWFGIDRNDQPRGILHLTHNV